LASVSRADGIHAEAFSGVRAREHWEPSVGTLNSLPGLLRFSTIGVALFDGNLQCRAFNGALRRMMGVSLKGHSGKQLHQVLGVGAPKLEIAFRRVWSTGNSLSNFEITAEFPAGTKPRRWVVNFFPITDESRQVRLVATTFCEVTQGRRVELKLSRLRDKFQSHILEQPNHLEEEFSDVSARTFDIVKRSLALLKNSLSLRFYTSETQLEAALFPHALYMTGNRVPEPAIPANTPDSDYHSEGAHSSPGAPNETDLAAGCPSPRERQVLRFLAEGKSNKEIGFLLEISTRTVECYRARIMTKLDLHSTAALVRYAIRHHIIEA
jgi:DNA-binding CsgD family transcriptional regulator/PAS domain-containing protein